MTYQRQDPWNETFDAMVHHVAAQVLQGPPDQREETARRVAEEAAICVIAMLGDTSGIQAEALRRTETGRLTP